MWADSVAGWGRGGGVSDPTRAPTGTLRARAILIRQALVRALIVLPLTLCPVCHSEGPPHWGRGCGGRQKGGLGGEQAEWPL